MREVIELRGGSEGEVIKHTQQQYLYCSRSVPYFIDADKYDICRVIGEI